jgi:hypothetical protein
VLKKRVIALSVCAVVAMIAFAGIGAEDAAYQGGNVARLEQGTEAKLDLGRTEGLVLAIKAFTRNLLYRSWLPTGRPDEAAGGSRGET